MYGVSKLALNGLTKAIAKNLVAEKIRVNGIACGIIPTKHDGEVDNFKIMSLIFIHFQALMIHIFLLAL